MVDCTARSGARHLRPAIIKTAVMRTKDTQTRSALGRAHLPPTSYNGVSTPQNHALLLRRAPNTDFPT